MFAKFVLLCIVINLNIASDFNFTLRSDDPNSDTTTTTVAAGSQDAVVATAAPTNGIPPSYKVLKNTTLRVKEPTEELKDCEYVRDWEASYVFQSKAHDIIYYFVQQCLDKDFKMIRQAVSYNYDNQSQKTLLPEGCPVPMIQDRKSNPCENGIALGFQLQKDFARVITSEIYHNPASVADIDAETPTTGEGLAVVLQSLPKLEKMIDEALLASMYTTSQNIKAKELKNNGDGSWEEQYWYPDGSRGFMTRDYRGYVTKSELYRPDGSSVIVTITLYPNYIMKKESFGPDNKLIECQDVKYIRWPRSEPYVPKPKDGNPLKYNVLINNEDFSKSYRLQSKSNELHPNNYRIETIYENGLKLIQTKSGHIIIIHHNKEIPDSIIPPKIVYKIGTDTEVINADGSKTILVHVTEPQVYQYVLTTYKDGVKIYHDTRGIDTELPDGTIIWTDKMGEGAIWHPLESITWIGRIPHPRPENKDDDVYHFLWDATSSWEGDDLKTEYLKSGLTVVRQGDGTITTTFPKDHNGEIRVDVTNSFQVQRNPYELEEVTTYDAKGNQIGDVYIHRNPYRRWVAPIEFHLPSEIASELDKAADNFSGLLENYVNDKVICFMEKVYTLQENYMTFVCAKSQSKSIRDALKTEFKNDLICKQFDCEGLNDELIDKMLEAYNEGATPEEMGTVIVKSDNFVNSYNTD